MFCPSCLRAAEQFDSSFLDSQSQSCLVWVCCCHTTRTISHVNPFCVVSRFHVRLSNPTAPFAAQSPYNRTRSHRGAFIQLSFCSQLPQSHQDKKHECVLLFDFITIWPLMGPNLHNCYHLPPPDVSFSKVFDGSETFRSITSIDGWLRLFYR